MPETIRLESLGDIAFYERDMQQAVDYFEVALKLLSQFPMSRSITAITIRRAFRFPA